MAMSANGSVIVEGREKAGVLEIGADCRIEYSLSYPYIAGHGGISDFYARSASAYERTIRGKYLPLLRRRERYIDNEMLTVSAGYTVMYNQKGLLSVFIDTYEDMGMLKRSLSRSSQTWRLRDGKVIPADVFFKKGSDWRGQLTGRVAESISSESGANPGSYYFDWLSRCRKWDSMRGYYLSDDGMVIYYQPGVIAGANMAIPSFLVPYNGISHLLAVQL